MTYPDFRDGNLASAESLCRVSVLGGKTQFDIGLPANTPVANLLPELITLMKSRDRSFTDEDEEPEFRSEHWTLGRIGKNPIPNHQSLIDANIHDGELLVLRSVNTNEAPVLFDDVIDAVSRINEENFGNWSVLASRWAGYIAATVASTIAVSIALSHRSVGDSVIPGIVCAVLALAFVSAATISARYKNDQLTSTWLVVSGLIFAMGAGMLLTPQALGAPHLMFGFAATLAVAMISYRITASGPFVHSMAITGAALGLVFTALRVLGEISYSILGAAMVSIGIFLVVIAPRLTIGLAKLPIPPVPTAGAPIDPTDQERQPTIEGIGAIGAMSLPSAVTLERRSSTGNQYLSGILFAVSAITMVGAWLTAAPLSAPDRGLDWKGIALATIAAIVLVLRGRSHSDVTQASVLTGAGAATALGLILGFGWGETASMGYVSFGLAALFVALAFVVGVITPTQSFSPVIRRAAELAEYGLIVLILPLAFWIAGVYGMARDL